MYPKEIGLKPYYKWIILAAISLVCAVWAGMSYFAFSLFVKPLQETFGWDRAVTMGAFTVWALVSGVASIFVGRAVDRFGPRKVMFVGTAISGLSFFSLSFIQTQLHYYLCYVALGIGIAGIGQIPCTTIISNWFQSKRGMAIGIIGMGMGLGGTVICSLTGGFIIPIYGWREAYVGFSIILVVIMFPLLFYVIKSAPPAMEEGNIRQSNTLSHERRTENDILSICLRSPAIWLITAAFMLSQFSLTGSLQNQVPHIQDIGLSAAKASYVMGGVALISSFAKLTFGLLCDYLKIKYVFALSILCEAGGTYLLMIILPDAPGGFLLFYIFIMGMGAGSWLPILAMYVSKTLPISHYGQLFGIANLGLNLGVAMGPLFAGYLHDVTHNYKIAFGVFLVIYVPALIAGLWVRPPVRTTEKRPQERGSDPA